MKVDSAYSNLLIHMKDGIVSDNTCGCRAGTDFITVTSDGRFKPCSPIKNVNDGKIRVSVMNPGGSIPEENREIIRERYQRSQHQGGRKKGTGIGLSIVSTFLKAMI